MDAAAPISTSVESEITTLTFLFTDIEGSTVRWERHPDAMRASLTRHDGLLRQSIIRHGGRVFKTVGDAFCAAFEGASAALRAAVDAQRALAGDGFAEVDGLKVRMALHAGQVEARDGDFFGRPLNIVARLLSAAHGGQIVLSAVTADLLSKRAPKGRASKILACTVCGTSPRHSASISYGQPISQIVSHPYVRSTACPAICRGWPANRSAGNAIVLTSRPS